MTPPALLADLEARLADLDRLAAPLAAAHLDAAIVALAAQFGLPRNCSAIDRVSTEAPFAKP